MNLRQMKTAISKFRNADVSIIKDAEMRAKAQKLQAKQGGFTLLELLVVVAILAIIAGAVISSLDGQEELAAQKTTVHTMAAMEEAFQIYRVSERRTLPSGMDSLLCTSDTNLTTATSASTGVASVAFADTAISSGAVLGGTSNVPRVGGGLTLDLGGNIVATAIPDQFVAALEQEGLTSLRYVDATVCDATENDITVNGDVVGTSALVDVTKPNLIFSNMLAEDGEWEFGAGIEQVLSGYAAAYDDGENAQPAIVMALLEEPVEVTGNALNNDVVAVFGIGPNSAIVGDYVARAPSDGNGGPDKYSNFSVAVRIATCDGAFPDEDDYEDNCLTDTSAWESADIEVLAILDAGGDGYNDEVAEARGNEEE